MPSVTRKDFLKTSGFALAALAARRAPASPLGLPIGLQPYTVRNELQKDFEGTLRKVAEIGYKEIELSFDFHGHSPRDIRRLMDSLALKTPACHYPAPKDDSEWDKCIAHAKMFGVEYMITVTRPEWNKSLDGWRKTADFFNHLGELNRKAGLWLAYHNHNFEFKTYDGIAAYDELLQKTNPKLVKFEMDCFWTRAAGRDPVAYLRANPGRIPLLHIKDLKPGYEPSTGRLPGVPFTEVGNGVIDWKKIFQAASKSGLQHYFVEQDNWDRPPLESAAISFKYLKNLVV